MSGLRLDMHLHTAASFDCLSDPEAVLAAAVARGIQRICVTDHDTLDAARWLQRRHPAQVIVGEEVKTAERVDIIGLFLREEIPGGTPARETCLRIREQGGIVYVPHPFTGGKGGGGAILPEVADLVHAVEGFNGRIHDPALNERAVSWAQERGLPLGAGSDAHTLAEVGGTHIRLPDFDIGDPASFLAALAHATLHGVAASRLVHLASTWAKVRKRLPRESTWTGTEQV
ncbi:MAG: PHP domain-containing protein [Gemmatimonadota bacterium]